MQMLRAVIANVVRSSLEDRVHSCWAEFRLPRLHPSPVPLFVRPAGLAAAGPQKQTQMQMQMPVCGPPRPHGRPTAVTVRCLRGLVAIVGLAGDNSEFAPAGGPSLVRFPLSFSVRVRTARICMS